MPWDQEQKFRLLLVIIRLQNAPSPKWEEVAEAMGGDFSWNACRQAFQKLKKDDSVVATGSSKEATPKNKAITTPRKRTKSQQAGKQNESDEEEVSKKRIKTEAADHEAAVDEVA